MLRRLPLLAALFALFASLPAAVPAQTAAKVPPRTVSIQVTFVAASYAEVANTGTNFDLLQVPWPNVAPQPGHAPIIPTFYPYASGSIATQLYQALTRTYGKAVIMAPVATSDNLAATIAVDSTIPDFTPSASFLNGSSSFPHLTGSIRVQGTVTLTPHVLPNNFVSLEIASLIESGKPVRLKAVASGETMVIVDTGLHETRLFGQLFRSRIRSPEEQELLIFITPTVQPAAGKVIIHADTPPPTEKFVSIDATNADLRVVVRSIERQANIEAVVQDGDTPYHPVTVRMDHFPLAGVLRAVAASAGAQFIMNAEGGYLFAPADMILPVPSVIKARPPINTADLKWHTVILKHANPADIVKRMNWNDTGSAAENQNLPDGVARVFALQSNNSLLIEATPEGYTLVSQIVKILDLTPQQVQLKMLIAAVPQSNTVKFSLMDPPAALLQLQQARATFYQPPLVTTDNDVTADLTFDPSDMKLPLMETIQGIPGPSLRITPRVNTDNTVTLAWDFGEPKPVDTATYPPQRITTLRSVINGGTVGYDVTGMPLTAGNRVFLFVTPTILAEKSQTNPSGGQLGMVTP